MISGGASKDANNKLGERERERELDLPVPIQMDDSLSLSLKSSIGELDALVLEPKELISLVLLARQLSLE